MVPSSRLYLLSSSTYCIGLHGTSIHGLSGTSIHGLSASFDQECLRAELCPLLSPSPVT